MTVNNDIYGKSNYQDDDNTSQNIINKIKPFKRTNPKQNKNKIRGFINSYVKFTNLQEEEHEDFDTSVYT